MGFIPTGDMSVNSCFLVLRCFVDMSLANSGLGTLLVYSMHLALNTLFCAAALYFNAPNSL
jgi:hypothetical protein